MRVEDEHLDVLQNIEAQVVAVYREHSGLTNYEVDKAYAALVKAYSGAGKSLDAVRPAGELPGLVFDRVAAVCEWRLGRSAMTDHRGRSLPAPEPLEQEVIVLALKRLRRSVEKWTKESGRQGYLMYISQFL